jgi:hypothetical protein
VLNDVLEALSPPSFPTWANRGRLGTSSRDAVMTDSPYKPQIPRVEVTAQWIAENAAKQRAYEISRRMWTAPFQPSNPRAQPAARSRSRGKIHDPRQGRFDL